MRITQAMRGFEGHLIGSGKAAHTVACYRSDLVTFGEYLKSISSGTEVVLSQLGTEDIGRYSEWLLAQGYGNNSRRRKLLTVRKMFGFFYKRKKLALDPGGMVAPHKIERVPHVIEIAALRDIALSLPSGSLMARRTRVALLVLSETGCLASEVAHVAKASLTKKGILVGERDKREVPVSKELRRAITELASLVRKGPLLSGFNRYGPLPGPLTARGLELMLESLSQSPKIKACLAGRGHLTPRLIRHSVAIGWLKAGVARSEVQRRLGLKTAYAFRIYDPML